MVELRRKSKPAPQPPKSAEEWINRATADGETRRESDTSAAPARKAPPPRKARERPKKEDTPKKAASLSQAKKDSTVAQSHRYISFAIDTVTFGLFREISFALDQGNAGTLVQVIQACSRMNDADFQKFPESRLVTGHAKRTMSFLLPQEAIAEVEALARRLRVRNKSGLYRYLIHLLANSMGIVPRY